MTKTTNLHFNRKKYAHCSIFQQLEKQNVYFLAKHTFFASRLNKISIDISVIYIDFFASRML